MGEWSRRQILAALGASALAPLVPACGASAPRRAAPRPLPDVAAELAALVGQLAAVVERPSAHLSIVRRGSAALDGEGAELARTTEVALWLGGVVGGRRVEQRTDDVSREGLARAAAALGFVAPAGGARAGGAGVEIAAPPPPGGPPLAIDPRRAGDDGWRHALDATWQRARAIGGSRVVHRLATLEVEDADVVYVAPGASRSERRVRTRAAVRFLAVGRRGFASETAGAIGAGGLELAALDDDALAAAADRALATFTAQAMPAGEATVALAPAVVAALIGRALVPAMVGERWVDGTSALAARRGQPLAAAGLAVIDDPTAAGLGAYGFDDEGTAPRAVALVDEGGRVGEPLSSRDAAAALGLAPSGHARRGADGRVRACGGRIRIAPGALDDAALLAGVERGYLLEAPLAVGGDPRSLRVALTCARAVEIERGERTGRLYGPVALTGALPALLGAVVARGRDARLAVVDGAAIEAPALVTRGALSEVPGWR